MLKEYIRQKAHAVDQRLEELLPSDRYPSIIYDSMRYSIFAGGKRLRPVLLMAAADAVGGEGIKYIDVACGLEMIHTYSLIHDDLPAMDNDDYRRGKLTNHKVYGEAMAILAGDALLTNAFEIMLKQTGVSSDRLVQVVCEISNAAGPDGMIGGQVVDLLSEGKKIDITTLQYMHKAKTGALFKAALRAGAILAGANENQLDALTEYAEQFGLAFQITDDILDVIGDEQKIGKPVGSDIKNDKATYVTLFSIGEAKALAETAINAALLSIQSFDKKADILRQLVKYLLNREN